MDLWASFNGTLAYTWDTDMKASKRRFALLSAWSRWRWNHRIEYYNCS